MDPTLLQDLLLWCRAVLSSGGTPAADDDITSLKSALSPDNLLRLLAYVVPPAPNEPLLDVLADYSRRHGADSSIDDEMALTIYCNACRRLGMQCDFEPRDHLDGSAIERVVTNVCELRAIADARDGGVPGALVRFDCAAAAARRLQAVPLSGSGHAHALTGSSSAAPVPAAPVVRLSYSEHAALYTGTLSLSVPPVGRARLWRYLLAFEPDSVVDVEASRAAASAGQRRVNEARRHAAEAPPGSIDAALMLLHTLNSPGHGLPQLRRRLVRSLARAGLPPRYRGFLWARFAGLGGHEAVAVPVVSPPAAEGAGGATTAMAASFPLIHSGGAAGHAPIYSAGSTPPLQPHNHPIAPHGWSDMCGHCRRSLADGILHAAVSEAAATAPLDTSRVDQTQRGEGGSSDSTNSSVGGPTAADITPLASPSSGPLASSVTVRGAAAAPSTAFSWAGHHRPLKCLHTLFPAFMPELMSCAESASASDGSPVLSAAMLLQQAAITAAASDSSIALAPSSGSVSASPASSPPTHHARTGHANVSAAVAADSLLRATLSSLSYYERLMLVNRQALGEAQLPPRLQQVSVLLDACCAVQSSFHSTELHGDSSGVQTSASGSSGSSSSSSSDGQIHPASSPSASAPLQNTTAGPSPSPSSTAAAAAAAVFLSYRGRTLSAAPGATVKQIDADLRRTTPHLWPLEWVRVVFSPVVEGGAATRLDSGAMRGGGEIDTHAPPELAAAAPIISSLRRTRRRGATGGSDRDVTTRDALPASSSNDVPPGAPQSSHPHNAANDASGGLDPSGQGTTYPPQPLAPQRLAPPLMSYSVGMSVRYTHAPRTGCVCVCTRLGHAAAAIAASSTVFATADGADAATSSGIPGDVTALSSSGGSIDDDSVAIDARTGPSLIAPRTPPTHTSSSAALPPPCACCVCAGRVVRGVEEERGGLAAISQSLLRSARDSNCVDDASASVAGVLPLTHDWLWSCHPTEKHGPSHPHMSTPSPAVDEGSCDGLDAPVCPTALQYQFHVTLPKGHTQLLPPPPAPAQQTQTQQPAGVNGVPTVAAASNSSEISGDSTVTSTSGVSPLSYLSKPHKWSASSFGVTLAGTPLAGGTAGAGNATPSVVGGSCDSPVSTPLAAASSQSHGGNTDNIYTASSVAAASEAAAAAAAGILSTSARVSVSEAAIRRVLLAFASHCPPLDYCQVRKAS